MLSFQKLSHGCAQAEPCISNAIKLTTLSQTLSTCWTSTISLSGSILEHHTMTNSKSTPSGPKPSNTADAEQPYSDEPVPSYETALREGAGGGVGCGPSASTSSAPSAQPTLTAAQPTYGCSPYSPHGTARIVIVPAPHWHHHIRQFPHLHSHSGAPAPGQPLLPAPVSMEAVSARRARPRFFLALLQAFMIYLLINLLVDLTVTRKW